MDDDGATSGPEAAVRRWWASIATGDPEALEALLSPDYIAVGGPGGRTVDRDAFLAEARSMGAAGLRVEDWRIEGIELRRRESLAVCSYEWHERGRHEGGAFELSGYATDVLVEEEGRWRHLAHHASLLPPRTD